MKIKVKEFIKLLDNEEKDEAIMYIINLLDSGINVLDIYKNYIIPALADYNCNNDHEEICIWKEHTRTSIVRTILENTYPYLIKAKGKKTINKSIIIACPQEEYHEIGAIIATNYFYLEGFKAKYIGANTPSEEIISAVKILKPDFLALSITNYYNLIQSKKLINILKEKYPNLKIILGGQAIKKYASKSKIQYDFILNSYEDIKKLSGDLS